MKTLTIFKPDSKKTRIEFVEEYMQEAGDQDKDEWRKYLEARWEWMNNSTAENWLTAYELHQKLNK